MSPFETASSTGDEQFYNLAMRHLLLVALVAPFLFAQLPDMYQKVDRVTWVVKDLKAVMTAWEAMNVPVEDYGILEQTGTYHHEPVVVRTRAAGARLGDLRVEWVQPLSHGNAYSDFLDRHGEGIFSLTHRAPSLAALEAEVARLRSVGVPVLQRGSIDTGDGAIVHVHFDTAGQGKYSLGVVYVPPGAEEALPENSALPALAQFAFVVRDVQSVSAYWQKLGFPAMEITHTPLGNRLYRGQPALFDQQMGWQRHGNVVYEWIQPLIGPTVYEECLKAHGEGFHHLAFNTADMDKASAQWAKAGHSVIQSGTWGELNQPGSGRFAYIDTDAVGGVMVELLWNYKP